ncbi:MAG: MFS transporter [Coxiellaceae bacterium]|nr:MFS transporter [Coxiellaceae bacterium]
MLKKSASYNAYSLLTCILSIAVIAHLYTTKGMIILDYPHLQEHLHISAVTLSQINLITGFSFVFSLALTGLLVDNLNPKIILSSGIALLIIGNALLGHASNTGLLICGFLALNIAKALITLSIIKIASSNLTKQQFIIFLGTLFAVATGISYSGNVIAVWLTSFLTTNLNIALTIAGIALFFMTALTYKSPNKEKTTLQQSTFDDIVYLLKSKLFWVSAITITFSGLALAALNSYGYSYLQNSLVLSATQTNHLLNYATIGCMLGFIAFAILSNLINKHRAITLSALTLSSLLMLVIVYTPLAYAATAIGLLLFGVLISGVMIYCYANINNMISPRLTGITFALVLFVSSYSGRVLFFIVPPIMSLVSSNLLPAILTAFLGLLIIAGVLYACLMDTKSKSFLPTPKTTTRQDFALAWRGQLGLGRTYWILYSLIGSTALSLTMTLHFINQLHIDTSWLLLVSACITYPYLLFSTICVWRCSKNTTHWKGLTVLARISVMLLILKLLINITMTII